MSTIPGTADATAGPRAGAGRRARPRTAAGTALPVTGLHLGLPGPESSAPERVLGSRVGIVASCRDVSPPAWAGASPRLWKFAAAGPRRIPGWRFRHPAAGVGVATAAEPARIAAVAETVERYCSMAPANPHLLVRAPAADLPEVVAPQAFALPSPAQRRRLPQVAAPDRDRPIDWCPAASLTRSAVAWVPAGLVHFSLAARPPNHFVGELTSTGVAAHVCPTRAVLAGLCEVLERDAVAIAWHARLPLERVDLGGSEAAAVAAGPLATAGARVEVFRVPSDAPFPVLLAVGWRPQAPHAAVGAACRPDPGQAAVKAVCEVAQLLDDLALRPSHHPGRIRELRDHAAFYASADGAALLRRAITTTPGPPRPLREWPATHPGRVDRQLDAAVAALAAQRREVLVAELSTADAATAGFRVVRVLVPGALDLSGDPRRARLGAPRLYDLPVRLGLRATPLGEAHLNRLPVPLA